MTDSNAPTAASALEEKSDLVSQTSHGPTLNEVASHVLRLALKELYPTLDIDPDTALVGTPRWRVKNNGIEAQPIGFESLTHALLRQGLDGTTANYLEGEHFLTDLPAGNNSIHLAVSIEEIAGLLNDRAPLLFVDFQARQLDFWNGKGKHIARWAELSDSLRKALSIQTVKGWDATECAMAREVFKDPDKATRKNMDSELSSIQACLIDLDTLENDVASHWLIGGALVLKATWRQRELLTMYTIENGYESFSSMTQLGDSLPARLEDALQGRTLEWRLYEPEGNVFDHIAWAIISSQLDALQSLRFLEGPIDEEVEPESGFDTREQARFKQLVAAIPEWLRNGSTRDIQDYSRYLTGLGNLYRQPARKATRDEIPSISDHAQRLMREAIIADPSAVGAADLPLDQLQIKITNSFTVNNLTLPNPLDQRVETLADFALENEAPYLATLSFKHAQPMPDWLTPAFLTTVAARVNIGEVYPRLIKSALIDDPVKSRRQKDFYRDQLNLLLPLTALEAKVKQECGIDEQGYRYVCDLFDPAPDAPQSIALYPLMMTPQHRLISSSDTVANMFIINPRDAENGPCLLYRPMFDQPLLQFPSRQNLLYALHQPGELRNSVLAWLPNATLSFEYAQYVFPIGLPSPWLVAEQLVNPSQRIDRFGRVVLESSEMTGDLMSALFTSNAKALVELADRQSASNAEQRWKLLKDSSWALFNVTTNFLSGTVGTAVWLWQTIDELQQAIDAREKGDSLIEWTSVADILLTVGIILSHHVVIRRKALSSKPRSPGVVETPIPEPVPTIITLNPEPLGAELPITHCSALEVAGSVPRRTPSALETYLDTLKVEAPDLSDKELTILNKDLPHLYQINEKTYAQVAHRWFNIAVDGEEQVNIVHPQDHARLGPLLTSSHGAWVLDLRLRLRGGGPKSRLKTMKAAKEHRKQALENALQSFKSQEAAKKAEVEKAQEDMLAARSDVYDRLSVLYLEKLEGMITSYQQALEQLREWRNLGGTAGYTFDLLRLSTELQKHLALWFTVKKYQYVQTTDVLTTATSSEPLTRTVYVENIQSATELSHQMLDKLSLSHATLEGMNEAGRPGINEAMKISRLMPSFTALQLKANEIGMAQELCLQEQASASMTEARRAIGNIVMSASSAAHQIADLIQTPVVETAVQESIELLGDLAEVFADADQRIQELPGTYPGLFKQSQLDHLRSLFEEFAQLSRDRLQRLLPEEGPSDEQKPAGQARPPATRPPIKVSKSRPREPAKNEAAKPADDPLKPFTPAAYPQPVPEMKDLEIIDAGLDLNLGVSQFMESARKDALRPKRIPADIQHEFDQKALKLEQSAADVDQAMIRIKNADGSHPPVATLSLELREAARQLRKEGVSVRANLYKQRKPIQSIFKWMHENRQVEIRRDKRGRIRTKQLGDFFQEYRILDKTNNNAALWVAHFHYETLKSPADNPTTAHFKVSEDYLDTLKPELRETLTSVEPIDGFLRKITDPALRKLFLDLEPSVNA
ncbi:dermonecrotic toxin domain-containing protein [Pseudomonas sp. NPDC086278]|uniref:dermonecrotic toxin domain-containing protein n=1 Tax=Pseudomonas sp. NPDC086278 TaxID=3390646 RepID=UPI003D016987